MINRFDHCLSLWLLRPNQAKCATEQHVLVQCQAACLALCAETLTNAAVKMSSSTELQTHPKLHILVLVTLESGHPQREGVNLDASWGVFDLCSFDLLTWGFASSDGFGACCVELCNGF